MRPLDPQFAYGFAVGVVGASVVYLLWMSLVD